MLAKNSKRNTCKYRWMRFYENQRPATRDSLRIMACVLHTMKVNTCVSKMYFAESFYSVCFTTWLEELIFTLTGSAAGTRDP